MYGLIFENFSGYIKRQYGDDAWDNCRKLANVEANFDVHHVYPEALLGKVAKKTFTTLGCSADEFFEGMGFYFVEFAADAGYGDVLALLGRQLRDFLMGLDNLHEYLKFSYPRLRAPSYYVDEESKEGLMLFYRSKRKGFTYYTMGQLKAVAQTYYKIELEIEVKNQEVKFDTVHVEFMLKFSNNTTAKQNSELMREESRLPAVSSSLLFEIFPFIIMFGEDMLIQNTGRSLSQILPKMTGVKMNDYFDIVRPLIEFSFKVILDRSNNIFEIMTNENIDVLLKNDGALTAEAEGDGEEADGDNLMEEEVDKTLHLKGQMNFNPDWGVVMFLGSPAIKDLNELQAAGLFICDLSMHDFSRDLLLASSSTSNELKDALDKATEAAKTMEAGMAELDIKMKQSDELLGQMIPKSISDKMKSGMSSVECCEIYEQVTIVFNDIPCFMDLCIKCEGMIIVATLNGVFGIFDHLTDRNGIYKVETVKDSFVGVSGAPERNENNAEKIMDMSLDMRDCMQFVNDPRPGGDDFIQIRLGSHTGKVVGGVVGNKAPRFCLFGDAMNTSSRMMSFSDTQQIHISSNCAEKLGDAYAVKERGKIEVKGKGEMVTFWVMSKSGRKAPTKEEVTGHFG